MKMLDRLCATSLLLAACGCSEQDGSEHGRDQLIADGAISDGGDGRDGGASDAPEQLRSALSRASAPSATNLEPLAAGNSAFAFDMLHQLAAAAPGENVVFSPLSISTALAMTYAGARGDTQTAMKSTLHFDVEQPALHEAFNAVDRALAMRGEGKLGAGATPFKLSVCNALWQQRGLPVEAAFLDTLALHYGAGVFVADFRTAPEPSRAAINGWVARRTEQLIPELLKSGTVTSNTSLVLTNTVYFNASWQTKFDKALTRDAAFNRADGTTIQVATMNAGLTHGVSYAEGVGYQAVALPYASDELAFVAVLPAGGTYEALEASATGTWFSALQTQLTPSSVELSLPKLDTRTSTSLRTPLQILGMKRAFGDADFTGITPQGVTISDVIHEAVVKVFEEGTIAAAATAVISAGSARPTYEHAVHFDRPFLYAIVDRPTGQILFLGRVLDPSAG